MAFAAYWVMELTGPTVLPHLSRRTTRVGIAPAFLAGVAGALMMSVLIAAGVKLHWSPLRLELILGALITGRTDAGSWWLGFGWHLLNGGLFALAYRAIFNRFEHFTISLGVLLGLAHWMIGGILLSLLLGVLPGAWNPVALRTSPFLFSAVFAGINVLGALALHIVYGIVVATLCIIMGQKVTVRLFEHGEPESPGYRKSA